MPTGFLPTIIQSNYISYDNGNILTCRLVIIDDMLSDTNGFVYYSSNDDGTTWEQITRNVQHTFTSTGQRLKYRIIGNPGETISVRDSTNSTDTPIFLEYNQ